MDWMASSSQKEKMSGSGKGRDRKKKQLPRRGMGVAQLERITTQQQDQYWKLPLHLPPRPHPSAIGRLDDPSVVHPDHLTAAGELPSFPNVYCCGHRNYLDFNTFPFSRLKKKRVNGEEMEGIWGAGRENMCSLPIQLGEGEGAKVLAVHQKGGKGADRKLVMEYGFFPASSSGAASSSAPGYPSTSCIDLSLKL